MQQLSHKGAILSSLLCVLISSSSISQVGINTDTPRKTLEIGGVMEINGEISIGAIDPLNDNDESTFLVQETDNSIKALDVSNPTAAALGYIQEYVVTDMFEDFIADFDTGVNATEYVMVAISSYYNQELTLGTFGTEEDHYSLPYTATFVQNNTWHIVANYPIARNETSSVVGEWVITTLIFSKDLSKQLGSFTVPMMGSDTGTAISPIID